MRSERFLRREKAVVGLLVALGVGASLNLLIQLYGSIWRRVDALWLLPLVWAGVAYVTVQVFFVWYLYLRFGHRTVPSAPPGLSVDVLVAAYDEPTWMVERTLRAAVGLRYPHRTYLLNDGASPLLAKLAERIGAIHLTREGTHDQKAGNINAALERTGGDFVAIFDIDHGPRADFLDRTLGFFADDTVGFVQSMITFANRHESMIAEAAAQTSHEYYNIAAVCKDQCGGASLMGSNAVIRRTALRSIGGYRPGLAEDLETSLALHGAGWRSRYVCEPLAPGLAPTDLPGFLKQQLKWSRGVFEAAWRAIPGLFFRLDLRQIICYSVRFSYYLVGAGISAAMALLAVNLVWPLLDVEEFLRAFAPFLLVAVGIRSYVLRQWTRDAEAPRGMHLKGVSLVTIAWPVYVLALVLTLLRVRIPFVPTPKTPSSRIPLWAVLPQLGLFIALGAAVFWRVVHWAEEPMPLAVAFGLVGLGMHWILGATLLKARREAASGQQAGQLAAAPVPARQASLVG